MQELEDVLGIRSCPVNWHIGIHGDFKGVCHRDTRSELYTEQQPRAPPRPKSRDFLDASI